MAGIGFELKKLFHRKGLVAMVRAYGYAGVICTGPMLLGILLQFGVLAVSGWWHVPRADQNLLVCMITYTLLASLVLTSFLSMPVTRFLADMLFEHHEETILPSFWGSTTLMLAVGAVLYAVFLLFSGATLMECDELSDGHQGLPRHHVVVRRGGGRGVPVRMRDDGAGPAAGGKPAGRSGVRLRRDDGLGRGAAAPVFPAKLGKPVDVPRMAGPVPAARPAGACSPTW